MIQIIDRPSPNFDVRSRPIDLVVLHYTGMQSAEIAIQRLIDPAPVAGKYPGPWQSEDAPAEAPLGRASTHYVVDEQGQVFRLVSEASRAWHAGLSSWEGEGDVNSRAIGIEIVNGGHDFGLPDFPDAQIESVITLLTDILARNSLKPSRVVAHSDIAPDRKADPGEKFPWARLAEAGVSIWPMRAPPLDPPASDAIISLQERLARIGYAVQANGALDAPTKAALTAFQRRFRPNNIDGTADQETLTLLAAVSHLLR